MTIKAYKKQGLIGGTSDDLDSIDGAALADDDFAVVMTSDQVYHYLLDESSAATEDSPRVITPDTNAGNKRWLLQHSYSISPGQNLLSNSGFGVWSNSDGPHNVGSQITLTDVTSGVCTTADTQDLAIGDLFKFDSGDLSGTLSSVTAITQDTSFTLFDTTLTDSGSPGTGYEVTPGIEGANNLGPDGWHKDTTLDVYRYVTPNGSYGVNLINTSAYDFLRFPVNNSEINFVAKFKGRQVSFAAKLTCDTPAHARLFISDGVSGDTYSASHSGSGEEEWLEVSRLVSESATKFSVGIQGILSTAEAKVEDPMLIFGDHIGEGNYAPKQDEVIWLESMISSTSLEGIASQSDVSITELDLQVDSEGKLPAVLNAIQVYSAVNDAGSVGTDCSLLLTGKQGAYINSPYGRANDTIERKTEIVSCNTDGNISYTINASGVGTLDIPTFKYTGVKI